MQAPSLPVFEGSPYDIGNGLGKHFRAAAESLMASAAWRDPQACRGEAPLREWIACVRNVFPDCWEELQGMADGMGIGADALFLWNCRDAAVYEACGSCTIAVNRLGARFVIHAQRYGPAAHEQPTLVEVRPRGKPAFVCTLRPGSLPGLGAAASNAGLMQVATPLSGLPTSGALPAAFIARSVLDADSLASAFDVVMQHGRAVNAHQILASSAEFIMASVEGGAGDRLLMPIPNKLLFRSEFGTVPEPGFDALQELYMTLPHHPGEEDMLDLWSEYRRAQATAQGGVLFLSIGDGRIDFRLQGGLGTEACVRMEVAARQ